MSFNRLIYVYNRKGLDIEFIRRLKVEEACPRYLKNMH